MSPAAAAIRGAGVFFACAALGIAAYLTWALALPLHPNPNTAELTRELVGHLVPIPTALVTATAFGAFIGWRSLRIAGSSKRRRFVVLLLAFAAAWTAVAALAVALDTVDPAPAGCDECESAMTRVIEGAAFAVVFLVVTLHPLVLVPSVLGALLLERWNRPGAPATRSSVIALAAIALAVAVLVTSTGSALRRRRISFSDPFRPLIVDLAGLGDGTIKANPDVGLRRRGPPGDPIGKTYKAWVWKTAPPTDVDLTAAPAAGSVFSGSLSANVSETATPTEFSVEGRAWTSR